jgi:hypothetical protein
VSVIRRIIRRTTVTATGCFIWQGGKDSRGYGRICVGSRTDGSRRMRKVHRVAWEHLRGPIPEGLQLDHLCRVTSCWNPAHLEPVTPAENSRRWSLTVTACPQGHAYDEHAYTSRVGKKQCRVCRAARHAARQEVTS